MDLIHSRGSAIDETHLQALYAGWVHPTLPCMWFASHFEPTRTDTQRLERLIQKASMHLAVFCTFLCSRGLGGGSGPFWSVVHYEMH